MSDLRGSSAGPRPINIATVAVVIAILGAAIFVWQVGPSGPMPMHFNAAGQVDRWGGRGEMAGFIALMGALAAAISATCAVMERQGRDPAGERFTYRLGRIVGLAVPALVTLLMTAVAFDSLPSGQSGDGLFLRAMMGGMALLFLGIGAFLGRAKPNPVIGVRTYWSLRSRLAWDKSNRLAGRLFLAIGVLGLIATPFAPLPYGFHAMMIAIVAAGLTAGFESWRVWRTDPERV